MTVNEVASPVKSEAAAIGAAECRQGWFPLGVNEYGDQPFKKKTYFIIKELFDLHNGW